MLVGVHHLLIGQLLCALDAMGHGDTICIADANFPAARLARALIELPGCTSPDAAAAVLTVFVLDHDPGFLMGDESGAVHEVQEALRFTIEQASPRARLALLDRNDFYGAAADSSVMVRTGERRAYGNVILRRGVVPQGAGLANGHGHGVSASTHVGRRVPWVQ